VDEHGYKEGEVGRAVDAAVGELGQDGRVYWWGWQSRSWGGHGLGNGMFGLRMRREGALRWTVE